MREAGLVVRLPSGATLEEGTFSWPRVSQPERLKLQLTPEALALLTDGIDLRGAQMQPWYERAVPAHLATK
jgi:hypothetical protein